MALLTQDVMQTITRVHDGIIGSIVLVSISMGFALDPRWLFLAGLTGALMVSSTFTGFCPVYFLLGKVMRGSADAPAS